MLHLHGFERDYWLSCFNTVSLRNKYSDHSAVHGCTQFPITVAGNIRACAGGTGVIVDIEGNAMKVHQQAGSLDVIDHAFHHTAYDKTCVACVNADKVYIETPAFGRHQVAVLPLVVVRGV